MSSNKSWDVAYRRDRARGQRRYVAADATRSRLKDLVDAHVPLRAIARATGLSDTAIGHIVAGRHELVQRTTAERIATLSLADVLEQADGNVPSIGATRRVQALMAIGWPKADLEAAGVPSAQLVTRARDLVSAEGWRQTRDVYDRLSMTPGPSQKCRDRARARGYAPPLAWEEDTLDDPRGTPQVDSSTPAPVDVVAVDRVVASARAGLGCDTSLRLTRQEYLAATRELAAHGASDAEISEAFGVSSRTVLRLRHRNGIASGVRADHVAEDSSNADLVGSARLRRAVQLGKSSGHSGAEFAGPVPAVGA
ncbi:helix-turn-helix domain-containing protein [Knoellia koreensis]|jgi:hypothetical protein|uniref:Uncharacterized protein n=1 Tax=Knoellia koreensis TaxID=2730921 RepID=A0A849HHQ9_9MICO|nr:helix-turn-helix domain-containing protein [Knoellia sp. DB2414S]NNM46948.1 hypothetical protein [Knoellia sp. DB2414S]